MGRPPSRSDKSAEVGAFIREVRQRQRLSLRDVSVLTGMAIAQLSKLEVGERRISVDDLHTLAPALNTGPAALLTGGSLWA